MNASLLCALLGLVAVSTASGAAAASADGSLPADIAAIPLCEQEVLSNAGFALTKNERKKMCQTVLKVEELLKIPPTATATLKAMCDNVACTAALKALYPVLPNCRYKDWAFKLSVANQLEFCGINPESIAAAAGSGSGSGDDGAGSVGSGATTNTTTKPPTASNASSSSSAGFTPVGNEFAPVESPTPVPTTTAPVTPAPTTTPKSAASSLCAATATAAMVVAAAAVVAL